MFNINDSEFTHKKRKRDNSGDSEKKKNSKLKKSSFYNNKLNEDSHSDSLSENSYMSSPSISYGNTEINISPFQLKNKKYIAEIAEMIKDYDERNFQIIDTDLNTKKFHSIIFFAFKDFKFLYKKAKENKEFKLLFPSNSENLDLLEKYIYNDFTQISIDFEKIFPFFKLIISIEDEALSKDILNYIDLDIESLKHNFSNSNSLSFFLKSLLDFLNFHKSGKVFDNKELNETSFFRVNYVIKNIIGNCLNNGNCNAMLKTFKLFF